MFLASAHSGHSLIGSLLDAHDSVIVANEADALHLWETEYSHTAADRVPFMRHLYENSLACAMYTRWQHGYNYTVTNAANGQFMPGELRVIGDKKGGTSVNRLQSWKQHGQLADSWRAFEAFVKLPIKIIHVWWSDSIFENRTRELMQEIVSAGNATATLEFNNTDFMKDAAKRAHMMLTMCAFIGIECDEILLRKWDAMIKPNLAKTNTK